MPCAVTRLPLIVLVVVAALSAPFSAQPPSDSSADARLRALDTEEWNWRQKELGRMHWNVLDWNTLARDFYERRHPLWMKEWLLYRLVY